MTKNFQNSDITECILPRINTSSVLSFWFWRQLAISNYKTRHKDTLIQPGIVYPRVIEARGENPEQYPDWKDYEE